MNQDFIVFQKRKEAVKQLRFCGSGICKPLDQIPAALLKIGTANQIQVGRIAGKSGSFNIKKQQIRKRAILCNIDTARGTG